MHIYNSLHKNKSISKYLLIRVCCIQIQMPLQSDKFKAVVEFTDYEIEQYQGTVKLSDGWVYIVGRQEYVPRQNVNKIKRTGNPSEMD